ncbi:MAG: phosphatase PAP2 family protein [Opitutales bacterium]
MMVTKTPHRIILCCLAGLCALNQGLVMADEKRAVAAELEPLFRWNNEILNAIRNSRTAPPMAAYKLGNMHAAIFDAVNGFDQKYEAYMVSEPAPEGASREAAIAGAAYTVLVELYGPYVNPRRFQRTLDRALADIPEGPARDAGFEYGRRVAQTIVEACLASGKDEQVEWQTTEDVGKWRETPPFFRPALAPHWPDVRPMTLESVNQFRAPLPPALDSEQYAREWEEVKELGHRDNPDRKQYDTLSSVFWSDDLGSSTPGGSWNLIAQDVALSQELSLEQAVRMFALMNLALADAGIVCWDGKYHYDYWRPETAIRQADKDGNPATEPDPDWIPLMASPPFPEYPSGHSTFSMAAAHALTLYFGTADIPFSTTSDQMPGAVRYYDGFIQCANEVGMSRIHGGIHFQSANIQGQRDGVQVAEWVFNEFLLPKDPDTPKGLN